MAGLASSQTTASWVAMLGGGRGDRHYVTATAAPCTGLFKPVSVSKPLPPAVLGPSLAMSARPPVHRRCSGSMSAHRAVLHDPARLLPLYAGERDALSRVGRASARARGGVQRGALRLRRLDGRVEAALATQQRQGGPRSRPARPTSRTTSASRSGRTLPGQRRSLRLPRHG